MKFFVADWHLTKDANYRVDKMIKGCQRPFKNGQEMSLHFIEECNRVVGKQDTLYIVGDYASDGEGYYRQMIRCRNVWCILGNHDNRQKCVKVFGRHKAIDYHYTHIMKVPTMLFHYPIAYWDKSHYGSFHLYGHVHRRREDTLSELFPGRRSLDIGVDNIAHITGEYRPVSELEVYQWLQPQPGHDHVEFYRQFDGKSVE
jgi:calcineurin-like phosphoesterase family protein